MKLQTASVALGILATLFAGFMWVHGHAEEKIEVAELQAKSLHKMNSAEIQLLKTKMELRQVMAVPEAQRDDWTKLNQEQLLEAQQYWTERVRELEKDSE